MSQPTREFPEDYQPRLRIVCAKTPGHYDRLLVGTPIQGDEFGRLPTTCPVCDYPVKGVQVPTAVEVEYEDRATPGS